MWFVHSTRLSSGEQGVQHLVQRGCLASGMCVWKENVNLEEEAGEEVHARDSYDEQPCDLEYWRTEVHHSVVLSCPAHGEQRINRAAQRIVIFTPQSLYWKSLIWSFIQKVVDWFGVSDFGRMLCCLLDELDTLEQSHDLKEAQDFDDTQDALAATCRNVGVGCITLLEKQLVFKIDWCVQQDRRHSKKHNWNYPGLILQEQGWESKISTVLNTTLNFDEDLSNDEFSCYIRFLQKNLKISLAKFWHFVQNRDVH